MKKKARRTNSTLLKGCWSKSKDKKAQVTLFIILAILIIGSIIAYFAVRGSPAKSLNKEMQPVYDYYLSCLEENTRGGIRLMGEQAGYIKKPQFVPGSQFMPFSSQLDFLGQGVPYWMYVSGNNILREQVPTIPRMQEELQDYLLERLDYCDFSDFQQMGYDIYVDSGDADVRINNLDVEVNLNNKITIFYGNQSTQINNHKIKVNSKLGKLYSLARKVYDYEKTEMFLENYALDVMRLYAPVTGTEISCTPKIFVESEIKKDIVNGLEANIPAVKLKGNYYSLSSKERKYFVEESNLDVDENINFLYSQSFPTAIEIYGDKIIEPIGLQQGLGILGFCYVPYHFVYDIKFPVMVQFFDSEELFQFPIAVIISKNQARNALEVNVGDSIESPVCKYRNQDIEIRTYDLELNPVEATITFKCLNSICDVGSTKSNGNMAVLSSSVPQCVNGFLIARAQGYAESKKIISSNEENFAEIILNKKYNISLDLGNVKKALVSFESEDYSTTSIYPDMKSIELIEGFYNVSVYAYENSSLKFPGINERKCVDVSESGISGMLGMQTEKCFDISIPATEVSFAVVGGGKTQEYILENQLKGANELNINVPLFGIPKSLEELQLNYESVDDRFVYLSFE
jgi:hypothetical protein